MSESPFPKVRNSLQGVLIGGGASVSAPVLGLGSFWLLAAVAGVAGAVLDTSLWLAALTLAAAAMVYGAVILAPGRRGSAPWVRNGRGGAGLSEEEFGGWAIKVNAALAFIIYIAAFLVCLSAALTLVADRLVFLERTVVLGIEVRDLVAIALAVGIVWLVNNRPRHIAYVYGPVTGVALLLLWVLLTAVLWRGGVQLPTLSLDVFDSLESLELTIASLGRLLAVVAGIEIFATFQPAFAGEEWQRGRKAFGSMLIAVVTSVALLLLFAPALLNLTDPAQPAPVLSQAMQHLVPSSVVWLGTAVAFGIFLTVAASSAQALQNLTLGLRTRRFVPAVLAQRNRAGVPDRPVQITLVATTICFLLFGARVEVYLPLYVAGSLLLLVIVAWAAVRRARRDMKTHQGSRALILWLALLAGSLFASIVSAAVIVDSFLRGAWAYLVIVPILYLMFHYTRRAMGSPNPLQEELGRREEAMRGLARPFAAKSGLRARLPSTGLAPADEAKDRGPAVRWADKSVAIAHVAVSLDGSEFAERALPSAAAVCRVFDATLVLISVLPSRGALRILPQGRSSGNTPEAGQAETEAYLDRVAQRYRADGLRVEYYVAAGPVAQAIDVLTRELGIDLLIMSTHGRSGVSRFMLGSNASAFLQLLHVPVILLRPETLAPGERPMLRKVLVTLDGSGFAEHVLPWVHLIATATDAQVLLLTVPEVPEPSMYGAMGDAVDDLRIQAEANARRYLERTSGQFRAMGTPVQLLVEGSRPATTVLDVAEREGVDLVLLATHGRGGMERLFLGSVADRVVHHSRCPVLLVPARESDGVTG
jgi:nucleotide-binding universal stress UspA family protein